MSREIGWGAVKAKLKGFSASELVTLVRDLYQASPENRQFLRGRLLPDAADRRALLHADPPAASKDSTVDLDRPSLGRGIRAVQGVPRLKQTGLSFRFRVSW